VIVAGSSYYAPQYQTYIGNGFDGVVRISSGGYYGSGALLYDGRAILTSAHLLKDSSGVMAASASIQFRTANGTEDVTSSEISINPSYDPINGNNDLALIWLTGTADVAADRYSLYRSSDETGKTMTLAGYGIPGIGATGEESYFSGAPLRLTAFNRADCDASELKAGLGDTMAWTPLPGTQLTADFDNGGTANDALGQLIGKKDTGVGTDEGIISPGDSGGPAFIDGKIAGVASYVTSLSTFSAHPDINNKTDSSFGEIAAWQRISAYQQWIDQSLRERFPDAPTAPENVEKTLAEGDNGSKYVYFLVQFNGLRNSQDEILSVDYCTRSGTAIAGEDFITAKGTLRLYPGENEAVIPVEVSGDTIKEESEYFFLDITNPVGGTFPGNVPLLTAMRTIIDNDTANT